MTSTNTLVERPKRVWSKSRLAAKHATRRRTFHRGRIKAAGTDTRRRWLLTAWVAKEAQVLGIEQPPLKGLSLADVKAIAEGLNKQAAKGTS